MERQETQIIDLAALRAEASIEFALMVDHEDGTGPEFVPAQDAAHADRMAETIYRGKPCWTVGRELPGWRYVSPAGPRALSAAVSA